MNPAICLAFLLWARPSIASTTAAADDVLADTALTNDETIELLPLTSEAAFRSSEAAEEAIPGVEHDSRITSAPLMIVTFGLSVIYIAIQFSNLVRLALPPCTSGELLAGCPDVAADMYREQFVLGGIALLLLIPDFALANRALGSSFISLIKCAVSLGFPIGISFLTESSSLATAAPLLAVHIFLVILCFLLYGTIFPRLLGENA